MRTPTPVHVGISGFGRSGCDICIWILSRIRVLFLLGSVALLFSAFEADAVTVSYTSGGSTATTTPGLKLTMPEITDPNISSWELSSFTWLSNTTSGVHATGRGYLLIFDADLFDPQGLSVTTVNSLTSSSGLIATSNTYDTVNGVYLFSTNVTLTEGKTYYFLNSSALSTTLAPVAPYAYGFTSTGTPSSDIQRWVVSSGNWTSAAGAPNFSIELTAVSVPEPATISMLLGFVCIAAAFGKRRSQCA